MSLEVAQFVSQNCFDLILVQRIEQSVVKHDAFIFAKAGEIGVTVR